jgi:hypothetical protein
MSASAEHSPSPPPDSEAGKCFNSLPLANASSGVLPAGRCGVCSEQALRATLCKGKQHVSTYGLCAHGSIRCLSLQWLTEVMFYVQDKVGT